MLLEKRAKDFFLAEYGGLLGICGLFIDTEASAIRQNKAAIVKWYV